MGGTLRLGAYPARLKDGSLAQRVYGVKEISERHRHRYEFNPKFRRILEEKGLIVSGESPDGVLVEIVELEDHPFFIGVQFHPEFKSRPRRPHPLFVEFVKASEEMREWIAS
jgi:CTP synthase